MTQAGLAQILREKILSEPDLVLDDPAVMQVLVGAGGAARDDRVVDLRSVALRRLEMRLDRLEDTHRSVIAAAYDNLAGTTQVHRAVLALLGPFDRVPSHPEPSGFRGFLEALQGEVTEILEVDTLRLVLETHHSEADPALRHLGNVLCLAEPGFAGEYMRAAGMAVPERVVLRRVVPAGSPVHACGSGRVGEILSEAVIALDLGRGRLPAMLVLGSVDPQRFRLSQGTELLGFFGAVFERMMQRFLG
ncbi:DUF484 family protein [Thioclava sp. GXIMD4216]|uniref:DUF484 family protein n=1 Tax=Thioclava litoralis TaxID=3076557 RepID=A0ABZ1E318_9RHOB|nr:DUF484 family protein [Thioclava sp. FTW29]